ncbi:MAG: hypothetical protein IJA79_04765, partial [Desulfovibrio sp.]|nr:hypothetical protein [Desulfovibrio sp.]
FSIYPFGLQQIRAARLSRAKKIFPSDFSNFFFFYFSILQSKTIPVPAIKKTPRSVNYGEALSNGWP